MPSASGCAKPPAQSRQIWEERNEESQFSKDLRASLDVSGDTFDQVWKEDFQLVRENLLLAATGAAASVGLGFLLSGPLATAFFAVGLGIPIYKWLSEVYFANGDPEKIERARKAFVHVFEALVLAGGIRTLKVLLRSDAGQRSGLPVPRDQQSGKDIVRAGVAGTGWTQTLLDKPDVDIIGPNNELLIPAMAGGAPPKYPPGIDAISQVAERYNGVHLGEDLYRDSLTNNTHRLPSAATRNGLIHIGPDRTVTSTAPLALGYVRSIDLGPDQLGYTEQLTDPLQEPMQDIPALQGVTITNYALVSTVNSGARSVVVIAVLKDGSPVAAKTYVLNDRRKEKPFNEAESRSSRMFHNQGMGTYHGTFTDPHGRMYNIRNIAAGDFPHAVPEYINRKTFQDLETIIKRLESAGVRGLEDPLALIINKQGRLVPIDPSVTADLAGHQWPVGPNSKGGRFTEARVYVLAHALTAAVNSKNETLQKDVIAYLDELERNNRTAFLGLAQVLPVDQIRKMRWRNGG